MNTIPSAPQIQAFSYPPDRREAVTPDGEQCIKWQFTNTRGERVDSIHQLSLIHI